MKTMVWMMSVLVLLVGVSAGRGQCPASDLTGDCVVDLADFAIFASEWLDSGTALPEPPDGMVWVSIDDPCGIAGDEAFIGSMSKYETTNAQYCHYLNAALAAGEITVNNDVVYASDDTSHTQPYFETLAADSSSQIAYSGGVFSVISRDDFEMNDHPVVEVSWYGATGFAAFYGWRLPTRAEWEAVADYDGSYTYGCGTTINQNRANYNASDYANPLGLTTAPYTTPVGHYGAFGYGLADMAGNVFEWTASSPPGSPDYPFRSGGSWAGGQSDCSVSQSVSFLGTATFDFIGFRVCRD